MADDIDKQNIQQKLQIKAAWFEPDNPQIQMMGILDWNSLEVFGNTNIQESSGTFNKIKFKEIPILHGMGPTNITLRQAYEIRRTNMTSLEFITLSYSDVILGIHYQETDKIKTISFSFRFVWGPFTSFKKTDTFPDYFPRYQINKVVNMNEFVVLKIIQTSGLSTSILEHKTTYRESFVIEAKDGLTLGDFHKYIQCIIHFLRLCVGSTIYPNDLGGSLISKGSFDYYPYWLLEYYKRNTRNPNPDIHVIHAIIFYREIKNNFESIIQKWTKLWFDAEIIMFDFFNIDDSYMSLNTQFNEYTNVIQRFYDLIHSERVDFRDKINWFLSLCSDTVKTNITKKIGRAHV